MMAPESPEIVALIEQAADGDAEARQQLLERHRRRLCQVVAVRLDRRLAARVDPSDVVQEALLEADRHLDAYVRQPPLPLFPWLRQFAWRHLIDLHRRHVGARRRSVTREAAAEPCLPDESVFQLVDCLLASGTSPSRRLLRDELHERVRLALQMLPRLDREVLVLRYLEQLSIAEISAILETGEAAVKSRHMRALIRLRAMLDADPGEHLP